MMRIQPLPRAAILAGAMLAAALATACSPSTQTPAADPSNAVPSFGANDMPPGTKVLVARQGQWLPATILQPLAEGRFLVHYDNTADTWNEVVGPDRIKGGGAAAHDYKPGDKVLVTYQGRTLLADVVMQAGADSWRVHYDGWGPEAAENVGPDRIRRPFTGPSAHSIGEALHVDVSGQTLPAKVIAATAADRWLVRFDGYDARYDQEIGVERLRVAPPPAPPPPPVAEPPAPPPPEPPAKDAKADKGKGKDKGKKEKAPEPSSAPPSGPPAAGEAVLVNIRGAWFPATFSAAGGAGAFKVKFGTVEEEVAVDRVVREPASLKGLRYQVGQAVLVGYKGVFVAGKVVKLEGKDYKIRFEGTGPEEDEVVQAKRLRPR